MSGFEFTAPVLIAGAGACGAVAALSAAAAGAEVLVIEQDEDPRGSTSLSQGLICAAGTRSQREHGVCDDADTFFADILAKTLGQTDAALARTIAVQSGPCLDWLTESADFPWSLDTAFKAAYGHSRTRVHGWPGHGGEDMIRLLHSRLSERGISVLLGARLVNVVGESGRARGVEIQRRDGAIERIGCDTLILATSGFAANAEMVAQHMPEVARARRHGHEGNRGDGLLLGAKLGGALADMSAYQGYGMLADPQGISVPPGALFEGGVLINADGRRFVNECEDIAGIVLPVLAQPDGVAWVIYDQRIAARLAHIPDFMLLCSLNAPRTADSMAALARIVGCDPRRLQRTFKALGAAFAAHERDDFGRSWSSDPPPILPVHALRVTGALYHTQGGLQVDTAARVQRSDGSRLPNVFAGGGAARGVSGPSSWGYLPAMGLCEAVTLGRVAGLAAARQVAGIGA